MKPPNQSSPEEKDENDLLNVIVYGTAISFGGMGAFLGSLRSIRTDPALEFSWRTIVFFLIGAVAGWAFWKIVFRMAEAKKRKGG